MNFSNCNDHSPKWIINDCYIFFPYLRVWVFLFLRTSFFTAQYVGPLVHRGWQTFFWGGLHHWVMNYQRAHLLRYKEFNPESSASVYLLFLEAPAGCKEQCRESSAARGQEFTHPGLISYTEHSRRRFTFLQRFGRCILQPLSTKWMGSRIEKKKNIRKKEAFFISSPSQRRWAIFGSKPSNSSLFSFLSESIRFSGISIAKKETFFFLRVCSKCRTFLIKK